MNLPNIEIDRELMLNMWMETKSDYAKEQVILGNIGLIKFAMKKLNIKLDDEDMFSVGLIGLLEAMNSFDPDRGYQFSTYATNIIIYKFLRARKKLYRQKQEMAISFSLDEKHILDNGDEVSYADIIPDKTCVEEQVLMKVYFEQEFGSLTDYEKTILKLRLEGKSQLDIAMIMGVSQSHISKTIKKVKNRMIA